MKTTITAQTKKAIHDPHLDAVMCRILESESFYDAVKKYVVTSLPQDFPGEELISGKDFLADLDTEIHHADSVLRGNEGA